MNVRIVITDSGLGGLSVMAELERRLTEIPIYKEAELIFFNSLYSSDYGYNSMTNFSEKVKLFNNALYSIEVNYKPDLILIACNTLSVVFPHTEFAQNSVIEVKGILDSGVALFYDNVKNSDEKIILFGTSTTIKSNVYKNELVKLGVKESQIINQACPDLETEIQNNPSGGKTKNFIERFVKKGVESISSIPQKTYAGFCCTHYGYSEEMFKDVLSKELNSEVEILNPNSKMLNFLFNTSKELHSNSTVSIKLVSQVILKENEIKSLSKILDDCSPKSAQALKNYEYIQNLFSKE